MKRTKTKMNNKGFTLVELIVVLVILAILAAILVPTLLGYIDKAKSEKDFSTAQSVRVAAQSILAEMYAKGDTPSNVKTTREGDVLALIGATKSGNDYVLDGQKVSIKAVTFVQKDNKDTYEIKSITVTINEKDYKYTSVDDGDQKANTWEAVTSSSGT